MKIKIISSVLVYISLGLIFVVNAHIGLEQCPPPARKTDLYKVRVENCGEDTGCMLKPDCKSLITYYDFTPPSDREVYLNKMSCSMQIYREENVQFDRCALSFIAEDGSEQSTESQVGPLPKGGTTRLKCHCIPLNQFELKEKGQIYIYFAYDGDFSKDFDCVEENYKVVDI